MRFRVCARPLGERPRDDGSVDSARSASMDCSNSMKQLSWSAFVDFRPHQVVWSTIDTTLGVSLNERSQEAKKFGLRDGQTSNHEKFNQNKGAPPLLKSRRSSNHRTHQSYRDGWQISALISKKSIWLNCKRETGSFASASNPANIFSRRILTGRRTPINRTISNRFTFARSQVLGDLRPNAAQWMEIFLWIHFF